MRSLKAFKQLLATKYGSILGAWRRALDVHWLVLIACLLARLFWAGIPQTVKIDAEFCNESLF